MPRPLKITAVSGGLQRPSRTLALVELLAERVSESIVSQVRVVELGTLVPHIGTVLDRRQLNGEAHSALGAIEQADLLIAATPIYRGAYAGLFKHLFDLVGQDALIDKPVLLAATGGSERHALAIDHQLRPLFSFFQAQTLPLGVYGVDKDFTGHQVSDAALIARVDLAVTRALPLLHARVAGHEAALAEAV